jgi:hypothetical protein
MERPAPIPEINQTIAAGGSLHIDWCPHDDVCLEEEIITARCNHFEVKGSTGSVVMLSTSIPLTSAQAPAAHTLQGLEFLTICGNNPEILTKIVMAADCKSGPGNRNPLK